MSGAGPAGVGGAGAGGAAVGGAAGAGGAGDESLATVVVALVANLFIAAAKIVAGLAGASPALLAEGAHSVADSANEGLLLAAIKRSGRPADRDHPFGYGKERFFYSLLAGVGIFVAGGAYSVFEGITSLVHPGPVSRDFALKYSILGASFLLESVSWLRAVHQLRGEASTRGRTLVTHFHRSTDPTVKTVVLEDSAALVGLVVAFAGILARQLSGQAYFDALASLVIGVLLVVVAAALVKENKDLLIGQAAEPELAGAIRARLGAHPEVVEVLELMTEVLGPAQLLVAARVDFDDALTGAQMEELSTRIDEGLRREFPEVTQVFLDATGGTAQAGRR